MEAIPLMYCCVEKEEDESGIDPVLRSYLAAALCGTLPYAYSRLPGIRLAPDLSNLNLHRRTD